MTSFQKILVPLDFSPGSSLAIRHAGDVATHYHATVTLAHVYQPVQSVLPEGVILFTPAQLGQIRAEIDKRLAAADAEARAAGAKDVGTKLLEGNIVDELIGLAKQGGYDLIVMGTHGRTGFKRAVMGSVAEKIVRLAPCAVLCVRLPDPD